MKDYISVTDLLGNYRIILPSGKPLNERALLLKTFQEKTGYSLGQLNKKFEGMKIKDLYYVSSCISEDLTQSWCKGYKHAFDAEMKKWKLSPTTPLA